MNFIASSRIKSIVYDTDFQTNVLDVAQTQGYAIPNFSTRVILNRLMKDMKNIGFYQLQDTMGNFCVGNPTYSSFSMIDWKKTGNIYTPFGGLVYNKEGIDGNGVNAYVNTNFNPATMGVNYTLNNANRGGIVYTSGGAYFDGLPDNNSNSLILTNHFIQNINAGVSQIDPRAEMSGMGLKCINRDNISEIRLVNGPIEMIRIQPSISIMNRTQVILRRNTIFSINGISLYHMGGSVNGTITQNFRAIYNQFMSRLNLNPIA